MVSTVGAGHAPDWSAGWQVAAAESADVDEHARGLSRWRQRYDQLGSGPFVGRLEQVWTEVAQVYRERSSQALRQRCEVWPDALWCGITARCDGSRIEGRTVGEGGVMVCGRAAQFELVSPAGHDILGIVVARAELARQAEALGARLAWPLLDRSPWLEVDATRRRLAQARLRAILALAGAGGTAGMAGTPQPQSAASRASLQQAMLDVLVDLFESPLEPPDDRSNATTRRGLVRQVHESIEADPDGVPSVPELCARLHVSRRTLQYAFESAVGMGPKAYLRTIRLNGVRRALRRAAPGALTVQEAAAAWGFWNLSQFASDYRRQFGERPSQTLAAG